jgi:hypothetical protein
MRSSHRRRFAFARMATGLCVLASLGSAGGGCATSPTEVLVTVSVDATVTQSVTSMTATLMGATGSTERVFQSLAAPPADANIPIFYFPTILDLLVTHDGVAGDVEVVVEASDPTMSEVVLARGLAPGTVTAQKTTTASVVLTAVAPPPDGGGAGGGGAGGGGAGGGGAGGGAGGA